MYICSEYIPFTNWDAPQISPEFQELEGLKGLVVFSDICPVQVRSKGPMFTMRPSWAHAAPGWRCWKSETNTKQISISSMDIQWPLW